MSSTITTEQIDSQEFLDWLNEQEAKGIKEVGNPQSRMRCPLANFFSDKGVPSVNMTFYVLYYGMFSERIAVPIPRWANLFQAKACAAVGSGQISVSDARTCLYAAVAEAERE